MSSYLLATTRMTFGEFRNRLKNRKIFHVQTRLKNGEKITRTFSLSGSFRVINDFEKGCKF